MSEWKEYKLGDVVLLNYGKALKESERIDGIIPVYSSAGLTGRHNKALINSKGLIIGRKGTIGKVYFSAEPFYCIDTAYYLLPNDNKYDFMFMFYLLQTLGLEELDSDSAVPGLNRDAAYGQKIVLPHLSEQTAIASILSSLDDKIDLLHRQNKTLEQLAETLFRQWFVEEADGDSIKLGEAIRTSSGGTPSRAKMDYYANGTIKWVKSKELKGTFIFETEETINQEAVENSAVNLFPAYTTLIAMYGATVGEYGILAEPATCNQAVCALIPNENFPYTFLFVFTKLNKVNLINLSGGSAQQNISQVLIRDMDISNSKSKIKKYHKEVEPMFQKIKSNTNQIRTLTQLRDTLLPKLMSGEVRVKMN